MRVAIDARELAGRATGVGRYLGELLACWSRDGSAADIALTLYVPDRLELPATLLGTGGASIATAVVPGSPGTMWEQRRLPLAIRNRADVLFSPGYSAPVLTPVPVVVAIHDVSFFAHPEWFRAREGLRRRWTTRLSARRAARVLTISEFSRGEIIRFVGVPASRIVVTLLGSGGRLDATGSATREGARADSATVLYVGSILNRRHVPDLVRAFALLARQRPDARLVLVGENRTWPHEDPVAVAADEGILAQVDCRSYVPDAELRALYARAAVFAFLSTYEGFGLTPLEAMAAGVPVVAYDTPVAREVYGDAAILVEPGDRRILSRALELAASDPATRARLASASRARVRAFSWERTAALTLQVLREAASR